MTDERDSKLTHDVDAIRDDLGATVDEGTEDESVEREATLRRLLVSDTRPGRWDPVVLDELLEPLPAQAPKLSRERRATLVRAIAPELAAHHRSSGSIEQVLHRNREAASQTQAEVAASVVGLTQKLTNDATRRVTVDDIRSIETTLATVENEFAQTVAAAWAAILDLEPSVVAQSFARSLQMSVDPPLGLVAGRDPHSLTSDDEVRVANFEKLFQRALDLHRGDRADPKTVTTARRSLRES